MKFADAHTNVTSAIFSKPGDYVLKLAAGKGRLSASSTLKVKVVTPPPRDRLDVVYTKPYKINSPLWNARAKALIVNWIPHCIDEINSTNIPRNHGDGGIDNFIEAAKALRGEPHAPQQGLRFRQRVGASDCRSHVHRADGGPAGDKEISRPRKK